MASQPSQPRVLITAGPTYEPIDAVRFLGNRSSGRMGLSLAAAASARNWMTTLLLGPTHLQPPEHSHLTVQRFQTAADLHALLIDLWPKHDVLLMAAAVADYTFKDSAAALKIPRAGEPLTLTFHPTPDLLQSLASSTRPDQFTLGFALEPHQQLAQAAQRKLTSKHLDAIVANPLETMDSESVTATLTLAGGETINAPPHLPKHEFAQWLLNRLEPLVHQRMSANRTN